MDVFLSFLNEKTKQLKAEEQALRESCRKDESNIVKVKINICGMCTAIYRTVLRQCKKEELKETYLRRLDEFPDNWKRSCEKAQKYHDMKKVLVEQAKLETMQEIRNYFLQTGGNTDEPCGSAETV